MLSHLNTIVGFAAVFAILSLLITSLTQLVRTLWRMKTQQLIECLERLFGELKDPRRFMAAVLTHPSLEGQRGAAYYRTLINPKATEKEVDDAVRAVLDKVLEPGATVTKTRRFLRFIHTPWPKTLDLDKQTVKDIGQTVYEQIGHLVDYSLEEGAGDRVKDWAGPLKEALDQAQESRIKALASPPQPGVAPGPAVGAAQGSVVQPFRGRLWMLATAAFPEAEGKTPPLKTYVAAFYDEADSSASDSFTWRIRLVTLIVSLLVAYLIQLDAMRIWRSMASTDPNRMAALAQSLQSLTPPTGNASNTNNFDNARQALTSEIAALKESNLDLKIQPHIPWGSDDNGESFLGFLVAVMALTLGAPFWFEVLKSAIQLKSAFSKSDGN